MSGRRFAVLVVFIIGAGLFVFVGINNGWFGEREIVAPEFNQQPDTDPQDFQAASVTPLPLSEALGVDEKDLVEIGGIQRPKRDLAFEDATTTPESPKKSLFPHPGSAPAVSKDANAQVAGLFEELSADEPPLAARSSLFAPEPFDANLYEADKQAWLNKIRPGRAFQPAQPGPDVKPLATEGQVFQNILQGEKVILQVQAEPGSPVTFYTPQVGEFSNRLTTHSVETNAEGIAQTLYTAGPGTQGLIDILAASPVHSGQIRFRVRVSLPESR